ncbi:hypothetical protein U9M73_00220 [Paenibacillus phoenicis]|uniref:Histidine kinase/HSP90-like ATPase domain-containing protein n=1 Tax=Paenibacillus phoenicis TaxID=554117 RepID=A0ABU5PER3_9BACL|nr:MULTISPECIES: hypothetical protein [Paenibacillus]MCT2193615.1 hypothetical protein [Paenibacillus sp. p3-SID1389]MEA3568423.1 hypothetical protein [Paenibacillus phoenicis]
MHKTSGLSEYLAISKPIGDKQEPTNLEVTFSYQAILSFGGTVSVQSAPGAGTKFTISLPIYNCEEEAKGMNEG